MRPKPSKKTAPKKEGADSVGKSHGIAIVGRPVARLKELVARLKEGEGHGLELSSTRSLQKMIAMYASEELQERGLLKDAEENLKAYYDYVDALKCREDTFLKHKRLEELLTALRSAAEAEPVPPVEVLERALKIADEAAALQPDNPTITEFVQVITQRLNRVEEDNARIASQSAEKSCFSKEPSLRAHAGQRNKGFKERIYDYLTTAAKDYIANLKHIPDFKVEEHIEEQVQTTPADRNTSTDPVWLSKTLRAEGDQLIREARSEQSFELSQDKFSKGLENYRQSRQLYSPPDLPILNETIYSVESEKQRRMVSKYLGDAEASEIEGRIVDALAAYQKVHASYHFSLALENRVRLEAKVQALTDRINDAKNLRIKGEAQETRGRMADAIGNYKQSLELVLDKALEEHVRILEGELARDKEKLAADRLWREGTHLMNQGLSGEALARFRESLSHWPDPTRAESVDDLEDKQARAQALRKDLIKARDETFFREKRR